MIPAIFIGHGSPMNIIEDNEFTREWKSIADHIPKPDAILCISAHWMTKGQKVSIVRNPRTIYDFYGFPPALYQMEYKAEGCPQLAEETVKLLGDSAKADDTWGFDHGAWCVLKIMYPEADIPVYQLSVDMQATPRTLFETGKKLRALREKNTLILGRGNVVHNIGMVDFSMDGGYDWAHRFDDSIQNAIMSNDFEAVLNYQMLGKAASLSVPTTDHFNPLLYVLGAATDSDRVSVHNKSYVAGSLSMTSYVFT